MAKEALQKQDLTFSTRSIPDALQAHNQSQLSVIWLPVASRWRALCKIVNSNIFSGNKPDTNQQLRDKKIQELITYCEKNSQVEEAVDLGRAAFRTTLNVLSNTSFIRYSFHVPTAGLAGQREHIQCLPNQLLLLHEIKIRTFEAENAQFRVPSPLGMV